MLRKSESDVNIDQASIDQASDDINAFLDGYEPVKLRTALRNRNRHARGERLAGGWKTWTGDGVPPRPYEWRERPDGIVQYREPVAGSAVIEPPTPTVDRRRAPRRTDTSLRKNPGVACPWCGSETFIEPLCPACREGRAGMAYRVICGDNADHIFYVPRGGE